MEAFWYNYNTEDWDTHEDAPEDLAPYLPKAGRPLFTLYLKIGEKPLDAYIKVLELM